MNLGRFRWVGLAGAATLLQGIFILIALWPPSIPMDFFQEWSSAHEVLAGRTAYPDLEEAVPRLLGVSLDPSSESVRVNAHPPPAILLGLPLGYLDYPTAMAIWRAVTFGLILACTMLLGREVGTLPAPLRPPASIGAVLLLTSAPVALTIFHGQLHAVLLALILGAWWADRHERQSMAGVLLGVAGAIKLTPILLLGYFLVRGRWRAVAAGVLAFLAVNALTLAILGPAVLRDYGNAMPRVAHFRSGRTNASLPAFWAKLFDPAPGRPIVPIVRSPEVDKIGSLISVTAVAAIAAVVIRRARSRAEQDRAFALAVTAFVLVGPLTWEHTLLLLMLPLTLLACDWPGWGRTRQALFLVTLAAVWLMPYTVHIALDVLLGVGCGIDPAAPAVPLITLTVLSYQCFALLILFALGVRTLEASQPVADRASR